MVNLRTSVLARLASLSLGIALVGALASDAVAQGVTVSDGVANCVWLRVKAKGSGLEVLDGDAGLGPKHSFTTDCYMQLVFMAPDANHLHGRYGAPLLCPVDAEHWEASSMDDSFQGTALADGNIIAVDDYLTFTNAAGDVIQGWGTHRVLITVDKTTLAFKKATFQTLGGEMIDASLFNDTFMNVIGGYTATGVSLTADKVPPEAKALVAASPCAP
jgi:hypothetical protein